MIYEFSKSQFKKNKASDFKDGDIISVSKYFIFIKYKNSDIEYDRPALLSYIELKDKPFDKLKYNVGTDIPYYIDDFLSK